MKKYRVEFSLAVEVEAEDEYEADEAAWALVDNGDISLNDAYTDVEETC